MDGLPLVSVVLISYNAENYIIEALESVKNQSYSNIELIISDDASSDRTAEIIENWLIENSNNFIKYKFLKSSINFGITANLNKALRSATGQYIKLLASDDILFENAIEDLIHFCLENNLEYCFSNVLPFDDENSEKMRQFVHIDALNSKRFFEKDNRNQYKSLLILTTPLTFTLGAFYNINVIKELGYYDEKYPMQEDYSFALKLLKRGQKFEKLDVYTYKYRVRTNIDENYKKSKRYIEGYKCMRQIREDVILKELLRERMYLSYLYLRITMFLLELEFKGDSQIYILIARFGRMVKQFFMSINLHSN